MDRITRVWIQGVRAISELVLEISPVTVLIGENGSCKSTILECLELLRKAAEPSFIAQLFAVHRGMPGLLRAGASGLSLGVEIEDAEGSAPALRYRFRLGAVRGGVQIEEESLVQTGALPEGRPEDILRRDLSHAVRLDPTTSALVEVPWNGLPSSQLLLSSFGLSPPHPAISRMLTALRGLEIHLHFDTVASWAARSYQFTQSMRGASTHQPAERLSLLGFNLANAWSVLINQSTANWEETCELVRLGIGRHIDKVVLEPDAGGGNIALALRRVDRAEPISAANLSDGQLSWLAFVAMARLNPGRSLLAVDEPELHLHPSLLGRVVSLLTQLSARAPVVLSTHSDRVLELLEDPAASVRVCGLDERGDATLQHLDRAALADWLSDYGDLGALRASGYLHRVLLPGRRGSVPAP